MNDHNITTLQKRISWGSIIAGVFAVIAVYLALMMLGAAVISPRTSDTASHIGTSFLVWTIIITLVSLGLGAFIAGRLAGSDGVIHGFLVWATSFVISAILSSVIIGGVIQTVGSVVGSTVSTTGNVIGGLASATGGGIDKTADIGKKIFGEMNINTNINTNNVDQNVRDVLEKTNIPTLQPNYLKKQLNDTKNDLTQTIKDIGMNPNQADTLISQLVEKLKKRGQAIAQPINREQIEQTIASNSELNNKEVHKAVDNYINLYNNTMDEVQQRINNLEDNLQHAKQSYITFKKEAKEKADQAAKVMSSMALWGFINLVIGAIVSALFGLWGTRTRRDTISQS
ncbi:TIGR04086 family membrane protein [Commensalibacter papalotli (ex Servin-Garciduenas et al. 2014)]|uniref:CAP-Gly protein n=1 Tax=Commensalibacter papalotli (ex Servin-Garciduenas et al. 2014) TaxID=1208583 RepID=W7DTG5_9PROT|nr:TIGR04086 family membrane protein [Commensalibacter papalotli (ex Servin-Garciduenas et al. 2014)]EUK17553.1 hypothetical protein COMX_08846 [Commensalibacter papalotli (ex Servin-Garciduenas et al. 2014)]